MFKNEIKIFLKWQTLRLWFFILNRLWHSLTRWKLTKTGEIIIFSPIVFHKRICKTHIKVLFGRYIKNFRSLLWLSLEKASMINLSQVWNIGLDKALRPLCSGPLWFHDEGTPADLLISSQLKHQKSSPRALEKTLSQALRNQFLCWALDFSECACVGGWVLVSGNFFPKLP